MKFYYLENCSYKQEPSLENYHPLSQSPSLFTEKQRWLHLNVNFSCPAPVVLVLWQVLRFVGEPKSKY